MNKPLDGYEYGIPRGQVVILDGTGTSGPTSPDSIMDQTATVMGNTPCTPTGEHSDSPHQEADIKENGVISTEAKEHEEKAYDEVVNGVRA